MVVGDNVAVRTDDYARAAALLLPLRGIASAETEEKLEERVDVLALALFYRHFHIYDCIDCRFGSICEVRIICFCQIDSPVGRSVSQCSVRYVCRALAIACTGLDYSESCHHSGNCHHHSFHNLYIHFSIIYSFPVSCFCFSGGLPPDADNGRRTFFHIYIRMLQKTRDALLGFCGSAP